jgi:V8-like Glu-specific endopeptidase
MSRKQRIIEEARRILGTFENAADALGPTTVPAAAAEPGLESLESFRPPLPGGMRAGAGIGELTPVRRAEAVETRQQIQDGLDAMKKVEMGRDDEISERDQHGLEAIVLLAGRPAILIQEGDFMEPPKLWAGLKDARDQIKDVIRRVGRIEVANNPDFEWLGTGWLAGKNVVITNRHVALEFSRRANDGSWTFRAPMSASLNLRAELNSDSALIFNVTSIIGIHDDHDMAALQVEQVSGADQLPDPLPVVRETPGALQGRKVYVIGYPAWDGRRNDPEPMKRIFADIYNVKRLQPGEVSGDALASFEFFHDCSTLGGNSGSPVIDLDTHRVLGLHFGGRFLEKNHAVPLWALQDDPLIKRAAINFQ